MALTRKKGIAIPPSFDFLFFQFPLLFFWQDIAASIDEEDVAKFTDVVKEFDSMTPLVHFL